MKPPTRYRLGPVKVDGKPYDRANWQNNYEFHSYQGGELYFAFADGAERFINDSIERRVDRAMSTIAGGEEITLP